MIVHVRDAVELGYCIKGIKEFCKRYGIDFRNFVKHGIDEDDLLKTGDAMAVKVVERARLRSEGM
jgi:hypothetical protein